AVPRDVAVAITRDRRLGHYDEPATGRSRDAPRPARGPTRLLLRPRLARDLRLLLERRIAQYLANDAEARLDVRMAREVDEGFDELVQRRADLVLFAAGIQADRNAVDRHVGAQQNVADTSQRRLDDDALL